MTGATISLAKSSTVLRSASCSSLSVKPTIPAIVPAASPGQRFAGRAWHHLAGPARYCHVRTVSDLRTRRTVPGGHDGDAHLPQLRGTGHAGGPDLLQVR